MKVKFESNSLKVKQSCLAVKCGVKAGPPIIIKRDE